MMLGKFLNVRPQNRGFSLAEILVATAVVAIITAASVVPAISTSYKNWQQYRQKVALRESIKSVLKYLNMQFKNGSQVTAVSAYTNDSGELDFLLQDGSTTFVIKRDSSTKTLQAGTTSTGLVTLLSNVSSLKFYAYRYQSPNSDALNTSALTTADAKNVGSVLLKIDLDSGLHQESLLNFVSYTNTTGNYNDGYGASGTITGGEFNEQTSMELGTVGDNYIDNNTGNPAYTDSGSSLLPKTPTKAITEVFVDASSGKDDTDTSGTRFEPFKSLSYALSNVGDDVTINLKAGTYTLPDFNHRSNLTIRGVDQRTCIVSIGPVNSPGLANNTNLEFNNLTFTCASAGLGLFIGSTVTRLAFINCFFQGVGGTYGGINSSLDQNLIVQGCIFDKFGSPFLKIQAASGASISGSSFIGGNGSHIFIDTNADLVSIQNNYFDGLSGDQCIYLLYPAAAVTIKQNCFINNAVTAVKILQTHTNTTSTHNIVENVFEYNQNDIVISSEANDHYFVDHNSFLDLQLASGGDDYVIYALVNKNERLLVQHNLFKAYESGVSSSDCAVLVQKTLNATDWSEVRINNNIFQKYDAYGVKMDYQNINPKKDAWYVYNNVFDAIKGPSLYLYQCKPDVHNNIFANLPSLNMGLFSDFANGFSYTGSDMSDPGSHVANNYFYSEAIQNVRPRQGGSGFGGTASIDWVTCDMNIRNVAGVDDFNYYNFTGPGGHIPLNYASNAGWYSTSGGLPDTDGFWTWNNEAYLSGYWSGYMLDATTGTTFKSATTNVLISKPSLATDAGLNTVAGNDNPAVGTGTTATDMGAYGGFSADAIVGITATLNRVQFVDNASVTTPTGPSALWGTVSFPHRSIVNGVGQCNDYDSVYIRAGTGTYTESITPTRCNSLSLYGYDGAGAMAWKPNGTALSLSKPGTVVVKQVAFSNGTSNGLAFNPASNTAVSDILVEECSFSGFTATPLAMPNTGGFSNPFSVLLTVNRCNFYNNTVASFAGGLQVLQSSGAAGVVTVNINDSSFDTCGSGANGGAVRLQLNTGGSYAYINNCLFTGNYGSGNGGAVYISPSNFGINRSLFSSNYLVSSGTNNGGALAVVSCSSGNIENCSFRYNSASVGRDGFYTAASTVAVKNCIFYNHDGVGVYKNSGTLTLENCIVDAANIIINTSLGNMSLDPGFVGTSNAVITGTSDAVDAGKRVSSPMGSEYLGYNPDIGYYEYPGFVADFTSYQIVPAMSDTSTSSALYTALKAVQLNADSSAQKDCIATLYLSQDNTNWTQVAQSQFMTNPVVESLTGTTVGSTIGQWFYYRLRLSGKIGNTASGFMVYGPKVTQVGISYGLF